jgi:hypothetical protein
MRAARALLLGLAAACALAHAAGADEDAAAKRAKVMQQRQRDAVARCEAERGVDCHTAKGLHEWLLQERSRREAEAQGSRSIHQRYHAPDEQDSAAAKK